jgi:hypothetical protein
MIVGRCRHRTALPSAALKQLKAREKETERKADTRRKVIAGALALALEHFSQNPDSEFSRVFYKLLNDHVEDRSRYLFTFLPTPEGTPSAPVRDDGPALPAAPSVAAAARAMTAPQ